MLLQHLIATIAAATLLATGNALSQPNDDGTTRGLRGALTTNGPAGNLYADRALLSAVLADSEEEHNSHEKDREYKNPNKKRIYFQFFKIHDDEKINADDKHIDDKKINADVKRIDDEKINADEKHIDDIKINAGDNHIDDNTIIVDDKRIDDQKINANDKPIDDVKINAHDMHNDDDDD